MFFPMFVPMFFTTMGVTAVHNHDEEKIRNVPGRLPPDMGAGQANRPMASAPGMSFSSALSNVKHGARARRRGWNGTGMFIFLVPGSVFEVNRQPLLSIMGEGALCRYHAHIDMRTATGEIVPWLASQSDLLDEDWELV